MSSPFTRNETPIRIEGARVHNLRNVSLDIPRNQLVVITGLSGSGKSTLALDTVFAEGQRQYIESLSVYPRQILHQMERPEVDQIRGLQPTISIDQKSGTQNPRSTVATITEVYDYLRLLFARVGDPHCYRCGRTIKPQSPEQILEEILRFPENTRLMILAPVVRGKKGQHKDQIRKIIKAGFVRARVDGALVDLDQLGELDPNKRHEIEAVIDRIVLKDGIQSRLSESLKLALSLGEGTLICVYEKERISNPDGTTRSVWRDVLFSSLHSCPKCKINFAEIEPRTFSFNSPYGICPECQGMGVQKEFDRELVFPDPILSFKNNAIAPWNLLSETSQKMIRAALEKFFGKLVDLEKSEALPYDPPLSYTAQLSKLKSPSKVKKIEVFYRTPLCDFDEKLQRVLFYGENYKRERMPEVDETVIPEDPNAFPGILPLLERIYEQTTGKKEKDAFQPYRSEVLCPDCGGSRLRPEARSVTVGKRRIYEVCELTIDAALAYFRELEFAPAAKQIATPIIEQIVQRIDFMHRIGLDYLTLDRAGQTLSGGELQRVRLASGLGSGLVGVCYILDEPSIGLHPRDNSRLIDAMRLLQSQGNSVLVVEHDEAIMRQADWIVDMGPGAGKLGGQIMAQGTPEQIQAAPDSMTGRYLAGTESIPVPKNRRKANKTKSITLEGATTNNLKDITVSFPLGTFICVTGVSGSGKSSLLNETLVPAIIRRLGGIAPTPGPHKGLKGVKIDKLIQIDQTPIGRSPRSNPATYCGVFDEIRKVFASTKDARRFGYKSGRFSFNIVGGRCEECQGQGMQKIEMHFLPDLYALCPICSGKRFNRQTLSILYKEKSIADVLDMQIDDAAVFFENYPAIVRQLDSLKRVGLGYLTLGQSSTTLSGGEAQRIKLATELARVETGNTLYVLDEPTSGLHAHDIKKFLEVVSELVDHGNTVIVIEHNLDVIKCSDWIIDLGPEGGEGGGQLLFAGTPEKLAQCTDNSTGVFLKSVLG